MQIRNNKNQTDLFGENEFRVQRFEYLAVIDLDPKDIACIKILRQNLDKILGKHDDYMPHLSVGYFKIRENDEKVLEYFKKVFSALSFFEVKITGPGSFNHGEENKSFILNIDLPESVLTVFSKVYKELKSGNFTPHITIAKNIPAAVFNKFPPFEEFNHKGEFVCKSINILKKPEGGRYSKIHEIHLTV